MFGDNILLGADDCELALWSQQSQRQRQRSQISCLAAYSPPDTEGLSDFYNHLQ